MLQRLVQKKGHTHIIRISYQRTTVVNCTKVEWNDKGRQLCNAKLGNLCLLPVFIRALKCGRYDGRVCYVASCMASGLSFSYAKRARFIELFRVQINLVT